MSDNKLVKTISGTTTLTGFSDAIGWAPKRDFHRRPQLECDELREVHRRHGGQHRAEVVPKNSSNLEFNKKKNQKHLTVIP